MLYWIWFSVLSMIGTFFAYLAVKDDMNFDKAGLSFVFMLFSIIVSWSELGSPVFDYLDMSLPNHGETIHTMTAVVISVLLGYIWVLLPTFVTFLFMDKDGNISWKNFLTIFKWYKSKPVPVEANSL